MAADALKKTLLEQELQSEELAGLYNETATTAALATIDNPSTIAYYKMADGTDETGNYNGTTANVDFNVIGKYGFAGLFNGSSSKINVSTTDTTPFDPSSKNFSISLWVNFNSFGNDDALISKWGGSSTTKAFWLGLQGTSSTNNKLVIYERDGGTNYTHSGTTALTASTWHHIVYVRTASQILLYIDMF